MIPSVDAPTRYMADTSATSRAEIGSLARRSHPLGGVTCMASLDPSLNIAAANADFFRQFARPSADICGRSIYDFLHPSARNVLPRHFTRLSDPQRVRFVERVVAKRGVDRVFSAEMTGVAVRGEGDDLSGIVIIVSPDDEATEDHEAGSQHKPLLTPLDARILEGIATGASTVQLAARLYLSRQGVEYHVGLMLRRLKAPNRAALVSRAYSTGILTIGNWPPRVLPEFVKE